MSEDRASKDFQHQHKGKTSETLLDKKIILNALTLLPGQIILDAGCGNGYMSKEFARLVKASGKVYALDADPAVIEILKSQTQASIIEPFVGDITAQTKLRAGSIDFIYLSAVFHGFSQIQIQGFIKEVLRLLKPNGILAILEMKKMETPFGPPLAIRISPEELKQIIPLIPKPTIAINEYFYLQLFEN
ncbi:MAG: class I SAM-dependent methyltransferase [Candidatus Omnitrophota bacterium]